MARASPAWTSTRRQRAQDEIYAKGLHRSLYIWDSAEGKPVPELAKEAVVSGGGLVYTFKLRDDAYFHHGRKMTADDVIWTYNRIMDGTKAYPGARYRPPDRGRGRGREGPGQGNLRPEEDRRLHAGNEADREGRSGLLLLHRADLDLSGRRGRQGKLSSRSRSVSGRSNSSSTCRDRASCWSAGRSSTSPASPTPTRSSCRSWARRRRATSPSATRRSTPRCWDRRSTSPIRPTPTSRAPSSKSPRSSPATWG